jgi:hypothetical protein
VIVKHVPVGLGGLQVELLAAGEDEALVDATTLDDIVMGLIHWRMNRCLRPKRMNRCWKRMMVLR